MLDEPWKTFGNGYPSPLRELQAGASIPSSPTTYCCCYQCSTSINLRCLFLYIYQAEIQGPQDTPYEGKFFQLKLLISCDFPASPPRGFFMTKIYHPNVDMSTGAICVNTLKRDWTSETKMSHVLSVIRCLLIIPFPESSLNDEAGKLFMDSYDEYSKRARLMADVHGRPHQTGKSEEEQKATASPTKGKDVLSDASVSRSNPLRTSSNGATTSGSGKSGSGNVRKQVTGKAGAKMSKKKSLKRL